MQETEGKYIFGVVKINEKGQIVIPREARKIYNLKPGDALMLVGDKSGMAMLKTQIFQDFVEQVMEDLNK